MPVDMRMLKSEFVSHVGCRLVLMKAEVIQPDESVKLAAQATIERQNKMAILKIVKYPEAVLERAGDAVTEFDDELKQLVTDMFETMYDAPGVGLAAPQVGVSRQVFVMDCSGGKDPKQAPGRIIKAVIPVRRTLRPGRRRTGPFRPGRV